jgi:hypothetical protein
VVLRSISQPLDQDPQQPFEKYRIKMVVSAREVTKIVGLRFATEPD